MTERVGFIGLGRMGRPMASNLARAGFGLVLHDAVPGVADQLAAELGAQAAASPADLAGQCDRIITMLPNSAIVEAVLEGDKGVMSALQPGTVIIDMSSSDPDSTRQLAAKTEAAGGTLIDAPVSGGVKKAVQGSLAIIAGGDSDTLARCRPLFEAMGAKTLETGPTGTGHAMKVINNYVSAAGLIAASEGLVLARNQGISDENYVFVLNASTGKSNSTENKLAQYITNEAFNSDFLLSLMSKDVGIARTLAQRGKLDLRQLNFVADMCEEARDMLGDQADHTEVYRFVAAKAGLAGVGGQ
ncbi:NAD(P)-dependent oxidoreductase [Fodinicurvata sp. EGI_FJ10296]|uniref:NAD(P)-dependent oxidoreductase n=1 Tax=Fodinicurvata sp. EGI_FJ10296 TaxID=3231908 RepID=UPI003455E183